MKREICLTVGLLMMICSLGCAGGDRRGRYQEQFDAALVRWQESHPLMVTEPYVLDSAFFRMALTGETITEFSILYEEDGKIYLDMIEGGDRDWLKALLPDPRIEIRCRGNTDGFQAGLDEYELCQ